MAQVQKPVPGRSRKIILGFNDACSFYQEILLRLEKGREHQQVFQAVTFVQSHVPTTVTNFFARSTGRARILATFTAEAMQ